MNPSVMRVGYKEGDKVEVSINEKGFRGSYFQGTIVSCLQNGQYKVRYKNLLEDDESGPLIEEISSRELRPLPPRVRNPPEFQPNQKVDVFDKDGWWLGEITGRKIQYAKKDSKDYEVYFKSYKETTYYHCERIRVHHEWSNGEWILQA